MYTNKLIDYVNSTYSDGKPLFMYLSFQVAHTPFQSPMENVERYNEMYSQMGWDQEIKDLRTKNKWDFGTKL